jgi:hypothetical protein
MSHPNALTFATISSVGRPGTSGDGGQCRRCHLLPNLLHGEETRVWGDQAYRGQRDVIVEHAPRAKDFTKPLPAQGRHR